MPRKARIDAPGALHHIIARGIESKELFRDDADRVNFLERLGKIVLATQTQCLGWVLMPNHVHLLLRSGSLPIATVMRRLLTGYAVSFNRKYRRHGHVFQNRYKSILCQEDNYLTQLLRYIHLNPLRAGLVANMNDLDKYLWSGHSVIMGKRKNNWQDIDYVLRLFGNKKVNARREYRSFVQEGIDQGKRPDLIGGGLIRSRGGWQHVKALRKTGIRLKGDERILGDGDFVQRVLDASDERLERRYALEAQGYDFNKVVERVAELLSMPPKDVLRSGKQARTVMARSLVCYWANRELGMSTVDISKQLKIGQSAVSRSSLRGEKIAEENKFSLLKKNSVKS
jgi:REP element-mobilizing transposase RayT